MSDLQLLVVVVVVYLVIVYDLQPLVVVVVLYFANVFVYKLGETAHLPKYNSSI